MLIDPIFEMKHIKAVPVIATFDAKGNVLPIYANINGNRHHLESSLDRKYAGDLYFKCIIEAPGTRHKFQLIYMPDKIAWFIPARYLDF